MNRRQREKRARFAYALGMVAGAGNQMVKGCDDMALKLFAVQEQLRQWYFHQAIRERTGGTPTCGRTEEAVNDPTGNT